MTGKSSVAPWSVKGVERSTRETARQAAQAAGMTVGAWIERAIREHQTFLPPPGQPTDFSGLGEVVAATQRAEVRSLEAGVDRVDSRTNEMVIPVALKVQELAHRLVEIEHARVAGRTRPAPEPEPLPPKPEAVPPDPPFESFFVPEPEPEADAAPAPARPDDFPTPVPPPDDRHPEPESPEFAAATAIPEERPRRRAWAKAGAKAGAAHGGRFRRALGSLFAALVALTLGAGSAVLVLEHGEVVGLPPGLLDRVTEGIEGTVDEGLSLAVRGEGAARRWIQDVLSLFEDAPAELPSLAEPPKPEMTPPAASAVPTPMAPSAGTSSAMPPQTGALPTPAPALPTPALAPPSPAPSARSPASPATGAASGFPTLTRQTETAPSPSDADDLEKAARQGDLKAQYELAVLAAQPATGEPDFGKAAYWFREAAVQGNASAQYNLGVLYEHGLGVAQDDVRALLWYHSAAEQGHARAQYNLGVFYAQGRSIPTDYGEAQRWFKKAADQGVAKAFYNLAILAESGLGGQANAARALMSRAALLGDPEAREALAKAPAPKPDPAKSDPARPNAEVVGAIQHMLTELGYDAGRADGAVGDKTRQAIRKFQSDNGQPQTGAASEELLEFLTAKLGPSAAAAVRQQR